MDELGDIVIGVVVSGRGRSAGAVAVSHVKRGPPEAVTRHRVTAPGGSAWESPGSNIPCQAPNGQRRAPTIDESCRGMDSPSDWQGSPISEEPASKPEPPKQPVDPTSALGAHRRSSPAAIPTLHVSTSRPALERAHPTSPRFQPTRDRRPPPRARPPFRGPEQKDHAKNDDSRNHVRTPFPASGAPRLMPPCPM
jgi:hypothetical protein